MKFTEINFFVLQTVLSFLAGSAQADTIPGVGANWHFPNSVNCQKTNSMIYDDIDITKRELQSIVEGPLSREGNTNRYTGTKKIRDVTVTLNFSVFWCAKANRNTIQYDKSRVVDGGNCGVFGTWKTAPRPGVDPCTY